MNADTLIQLWKMFKKEEPKMKPLRFWAIWASLTAMGFMYLWPTFYRAIQ